MDLLKGALFSSSEKAFVSVSNLTNHLSPQYSFWWPMEAPQRGVKVM
jgi:hypothetical protein